MRLSSSAMAVPGLYHLLHVVEAVLSNEHEYAALTAGVLMQQHI